MQSDLMARVVTTLCDALEQILENQRAMMPLSSDRYDPTLRQENAVRDLCNDVVKHHREYRYG